MHDFLGNIGRVIVALWQIGRAQAPGLAHHAWDFYALWTSRLTRLALIVVVGQPIAVILVSLAGVHELTVLTALTPILGVLFLMIVAGMPRHQDELAAGLAVTAGLSAWDRTAKILNVILRGLLLFLLLDMAFGLYFSLLPIENDRGLALWIVLLGLIFLFSVALMRPERRKKLISATVTLLLVGSAITLIVIIPAVLANGGRKETKSDAAEAFKNDANAETNVAGDRVVQVTMRGLENCSDEVDLTLGPVEGRNDFFGSPNTLVRWLDYGGEEGPITKRWGPKGGRICFLGSTGEMVTVRQIPN